MLVYPDEARKQPEEESGQPPEKTQPDPPAHTAALRHTHATLLFEENVYPKVVSESSWSQFSHGDARYL